MFQGNAELKMSLLKTQKKRNPKLGSPLDAKIYLKSRKRKPGRKYKSNMDEVQKIMDGIKEMMKERRDADVLLSSGKSHGADWLVGRQGASSTATPAPAILEPCVEQLTAKISRNLESEMEAKINRKVRENMTWLLKKLEEANPDIKLDIGDFCTTAPSDQDDNGTPITEGSATS